jgi:hypothetical protein
MNWTRIIYTLIGMLAGLTISVFILGSTGSQAVSVGIGIGFVVGIGLAALAERRAKQMTIRKGPS